MRQERVEYNYCIFTQSARVAGIEHKAATKNEARSRQRRLLQPLYIKKLKSAACLEICKGEFDMCDYSLYGIENRLAEEGEILVVHQFHSGSKGLTSPEYLKPCNQQKGWIAAFKKMFASQPRVCAVCIPDGAQLVLRGISPALQQACGISDTEAVTFRQLSANTGTYRDAVEFRNGVRVGLLDLEEGQSIEVLALSSEKGVLEVHSNGRRVWQTRSSGTRGSTVAIPEEMAVFFPDGGPQIPNLIRRIGR
jgi:hypothetical protein